MKTLILISVFAGTFSWNVVSAQQEQLTLVPDYARYGVSISEGLASSGHGYDMYFGVSVNRIKKSMQAGVVFDQSSGKIGGMNLKYKHYLNKSIRRGLVPVQGKLNPYVGYRFIYRSETVTSEPIIVKSPSTVKLKSSTTVTGPANSVEHFLGAGVQYHLNSLVVLDASLGAGYYIGDLRRDNKDHFYGIAMFNSGLGLSGEIGISVILVK